MITDFVHPTDHQIVRWLNESRASFWIAGGACLSWYKGRSCESDIDLFFPSEEEYLKMKHFFEKNQTIKFFSINPQQISTIIQTKNATTYSVTQDKDYDVQAIHRKFYPTVDDLLADFDISVCKIAWDGNRIWTGKYFARDVADRRLRFESVSRNSTKRLVKYWAYGYNPMDEDLTKLCTAEDVSWEFSDDDYGA